jgi:hypothetical protein
LLLVGPFILGNIQNTLAVRNEAALWTVLAFIYVAIVLSATTWILWRRRWLTLIYNVDPTAFRQALARIMDQMGLTWARVGSQILIRAVEGGGEGCSPVVHQAKQRSDSPEPGRELPGRTITALTHPDRQLEPVVLLELEESPFMRHITMKWHPASEPLRQSVERELYGVCRDLHAARNPMSLVFLGCACLLMVIIVSGMVLLVVVGSRF